MSMTVPFRAPRPSTTQFCGLQSRSGNVLQVVSISCGFPSLSDKDVFHVREQINIPVDTPYNVIGWSVVNIQVGPRMEYGQCLSCTLTPTSSPTPVLLSYRLTLPYRARHCTNHWNVVFVSLSGGSVSGSSLTWTPSSVTTSIKPSTLEPTATTTCSL